MNVRDIYYNKNNIHKIALKVILKQNRTYSFFEGSGVRGENDKFD